MVTERLSCYNRLIELLAGLGPVLIVYTRRVALYKAFLPFLGQMADMRAFEPAVFLIIELPSGVADSP
jgi:hypothetical protein